jgi:hypothetical protein
VARIEFIRKKNNGACCDVKKKMVVRYMTVLTQLFVTMKDILPFYNFSNEDGPKIANQLSKKAPQQPRRCTLKNMEFKMKC